VSPSLRFGLEIIEPSRIISRKGMGGLDKAVPPPGTAREEDRGKLRVSLGQGGVSKRDLLLS